MREVLGNTAHNQFCVFFIVVVALKIGFGVEQAEIN
jgi:hypothetical protein